MSVVNPSQSNAGDVITANAINNPVNQIAAVINGGLDSTNITPGSITAASLSPTLASSVAGGYTTLSTLPTSTVYNGNGSYTQTYNTIDLTNVLSPGFRIRTTRSTPAGVQSTSLNGTTQYWSKATPNGMTFTTAFAAGGHFKPSAYQSGVLQSRWDGTNGWILSVNASGQVVLLGYNGGAANFRGVSTYQSIPLNKYSHIVAQVDMANTTNDATNNYIMINGISVPVLTTQGGTNPTSLNQGTGSYQVGAQNGAVFYAGKAAQVFVFSGKLTQATVQSYISQGLLGTEPTLVSAYSFAGNANDLNTTNANNLTSNGSVTATATDAPWGGQGNGTISSTLDYAIVQSVAFSTNTTVVLQVPEGCTIPTIGTVAAVVYSSNAVPFGFPKQRGKWQVISLLQSPVSNGLSAINAWVSVPYVINVPIGSWVLGYQMNTYLVSTVAGLRSGFFTIAPTPPTNGVYADLFLSRNYAASATGNVEMLTKELSVDLAAAATYTVYVQIDSASGTESFQILGNASYIIAENAYL